MEDLSTIINKVQSSEELDFEDGLLLMKSMNLSLIGALADNIRKKQLATGSCSLLTAI